MMQVQISQDSLSVWICTLGSFQRTRVTFVTSLVTNLRPPLYTVTPTLLLSFGCVLMAAYIVNETVICWCQFVVMQSVKWTLQILTVASVTSWPSLVRISGALPCILTSVTTYIIGGFFYLLSDLIGHVFWHLPKQALNYCFGLM